MMLRTPWMFSLFEGDKGVVEVGFISLVDCDVECQIPILFKQILLKA